MEVNQETALEKLDKVRARIFNEGMSERNPKLLVIASELGEIQKLFLEENYKMNPGKIISNENVTELDRGFEGRRL